jgi:hypothetical protein
VAESKIISDWLKQGYKEGVLLNQRANLLRIIEVKFKAPVPESIRVVVEETIDMAKLTEWFDLAIDERSLDEIGREITAR